MPFVGVELVEGAPFAVLAVITPVVDYALTRGEIAADNIALFGYSLGGYLVARAADFEHRIAPPILDDGIHDFHAAFFHAAFTGSLPLFLGSWIEEGRDDVAVPVLTMLTALSTRVRWGLRIGMWVFGTDSFADLIGTARDYTLDGITHQITAANLIMDPTTTRTSRASRNRSRRPSPAPSPPWSR